MHNTNARLRDGPRRKWYRVLGIISAVLVVALVIVLISMRPAAVLPNAPDGEMIYEGGRDVDSVAVQSAAINPTASGLSLTLSFTGWTAQGEAVPIQSIPLLTVKRYQNPERLAVAVPDLADWSAITDLEFPNTPGVSISSVFCLDRTLYWQLSGPAAVSLQGQGGSLRLTLESVSRSGQSGFVVLTDACDRVEYVPLLGSLLQLGFSPVRSADGVTVVLQSRRFGNKSDAQALERTARALSQSAGAPASVWVERFDGNRLPQPNPSPDKSAIARLFDGAQTELIMRDAQILAKADASPVYLVERANGALLTLNESGTRAALPVQHIPSVVCAALSPNARYAALATDNGDMQIIDAKTGRGSILNETTPNETEVRAETTTTFAWFDDTMLAMMMGDPLRFLSVDASLPDDDPDAIRRIDPYPGVEGEMLGTADRLFLLDEQRMLYRITPSDASRAAIGLADRFAVSPDGEMVVLMSGDEQGATLVFNDLRAWQPKLIGVGMPVEDICVGDGGTVYILMNESSGFRLYRYNASNGTVTALGRMPKSKLYATDSPNALIVNALGDDDVWTVYRLTFGG